MCGNIGIIDKGKAGFFHNQIKALYELLYIDALRGEDSTGLCLIEKDGSATVAKSAQDAYFFLCSKEWGQLSKKAVIHGKAFIGHNRKATVGKSIDKNAHPFVVNDEFVFVHNGSLHFWKHLGHDTEVDSEALGRHIHRAIRENNLEEALADVHGAYACIWYDLVTDKIQMVRNKERPLYIVETGTTFFWASEIEMVKLVCERNNLHILNYREVPVDCLVSFDLSDPDMKPETTYLKLQKKSPPTTAHTTGHHGGTPTVPGTIKKQGYCSLFRTKREFKAWKKTKLQDTVWFWADELTDMGRANDNGVQDWRLEGVLDDYGPEKQDVIVFAHISGREKTVYRNFGGEFVSAIISDIYVDVDGQVIVVADQPVKVARQHKEYAC